MSLEAWFMDSSDEDQRKPHRLSPDQPVSLDELKTLGVFYWKVTTQLTANLAPVFYICTVFIYKASYRLNMHCDLSCRHFRCSHISYVLIQQLLIIHTQHTNLNKVINLSQVLAVNATLLVYVIITKDIH